MHIGLEILKIYPYKIINKDGNVSLTNSVFWNMEINTYQKTGQLY